MNVARANFVPIDNKNARVFGLDNILVCWKSVYRQFLRDFLLVWCSPMPEEGLVELKFRLYDGSDIGPNRYSSASTVAMLKEKIVAEWPRGKKIAPKASSDIKLISGGKILENSKTVSQCKVPFGELQVGVVTMHVIVQPSLVKSKTEKKVDDSPKKNTCTCSIL